MDGWVTACQSSFQDSINKQGVRKPQRSHSRCKVMTKSKLYSQRNLIVAKDAMVAYIQIILFLCNGAKL